MKTVWKVVRNRELSAELSRLGRDGDPKAGAGEYFSACAACTERVVYSTKRWTKAPDPRRPLFVFGSKEDAQRFIAPNTGFPSDHTYRIFRAVAEMHTPDPESHFGRFTWPEGTMFANKVKLIR